MMMNNLGQALWQVLVPASFRNHNTSNEHYQSLRPHHLLLFYGLYKAVVATGIVSRLTQSLQALASNATESFIPLIHAGYIPDCIIRFGIRLQLKHHLQILASTSCTEALEKKLDIIKQLKTMPIAIETDAANEQHYEVPAAFYQLTLGPHRKYSSGLWKSKSVSLEESERAMLDLYCQRAGLVDAGMHIVDLGCGWGSLTLYIAQQYPNCRITGISNSASQRQYILETAKQRGLNLNNIEIITCNVADDKGALDKLKHSVDLVMTVEMLEHMKNYQKVLQKVHGFLKPNGKLFVHIFTHKKYSYHFEDGWMSQNFFTGGTMPSDDLLLYFAQDFYIEQHWRVSGTHYEKTSNAWLHNLDVAWKNGTLQPILQQAYGGNDSENDDNKNKVARKWYVNWRLFFMACAELWGYDNGQEWIVSHYKFVAR